MTNNSLNIHNPKKVVFILGTSHCGSTLLDLLLGSHSKVFSVGELASLVPQMKKSGTDNICGICEGHCSFWDDRGNKSVLRRYFGKYPFSSFISPFIQNQKNIYRHLLEWSGAEVLVDSSKDADWFMRQLHHLHSWDQITPYVIYLIRDGRAVVNSYLRKYPELGIKHISHTWKRQFLQLNEFYRKADSQFKMQVSYEDLARNPIEEVHKICKFLDLPFEEDMLRYWEHDHHIINGNLGTRSLIYKFRAQFQSNHWAERLDEVDNRHRNFYSRMGLAIRLDERWKEELSKEDLAVFNMVAKDLVGFKKED
jgi:hypothetical protein